MVHLLRNLRTAPEKQEVPDMAYKNVDDELREKITGLSPRLQEAFLRSVERLYERESQLMLKFIAESRATLGMTKQEFDDEQEVLRETQNKISESHEAERKKWESRRPRSVSSLRPGDYVGGSDMESLSTDTTSEHSDTTISFVNESPKFGHAPRSASPRPGSRGRALSPRPPRAVSPLPQKKSAPAPRPQSGAPPPVPLRSHDVAAVIKADPGAVQRGQGEPSVHVPSAVTVHRHGWGEEPLEPVQAKPAGKEPVKPSGRLSNEPVKTHKQIVRLDSEVFALPGRPSSASSAGTTHSKSPSPAALEGRSATRISLIEHKDNDVYEKVSSSPGRNDPEQVSSPAALEGRSATRISLIEHKDNDVYEKEKDELMRELSMADGRMANERQRQATLLEMKKSKQRQKKEENEEMVNELLEQTVTHLRQKAVDKERQASKIKEKLEQKKREKTELELMSHGHQENNAVEEVVIGEGEDEESSAVLDTKPRQRRREQVEITEL